MPESPSIISLGRLCMLDGFSLHWPAGESPFIIDPTGHRIDMTVHGFVPYISSAPHDAKLNASSIASPSLSTSTVPQLGDGQQPATVAGESRGSAAGGRW